LGKELFSWQSALLVHGDSTLQLRFRNLLVSDADWLTEIVNDPEVAKYSLSVYFRTEHEVEEFVKKDLEDNETKHIVAELDGEPAGDASIWWRTAGRDRHVAWLGISVRRKHWGKGVGSGLMKEILPFARESGFRKLMLGVFEGNERALNLYTKFGFRREAYEREAVYIDGSWRKHLIMGLELAPCKPKLEATSVMYSAAKSPGRREARIQIRQLENHDLDEINRLQNSAESTKSSHRISPVTKEESRRWYEGIKSDGGKYCFACFEGDRLLGYLQFRTYLLPFACLRFEEVIVDEAKEITEVAEALVEAVRGFRERYCYHKIFGYVPETSMQIASALEHQRFKKMGAMKDYYLIDGHYVDVGVHEYPSAI
jgi:RimJ/RimL family protein N-acetyltransferase